MYKAILSYDGTRYFGWQKTSTGPSIQEELEKALQKVTGESSSVEAASRTDRGVHARRQVIQFEMKLSRDPQKLLRSLNAVLPDDIQVLELYEKEFHPTVDAIGKEYQYQICQGPVQEPIRRRYSWHIPPILDREKIEHASKDLLGTHDFSAFANEKEKNPLCTIHRLKFDGTFQIQGDRFLYKMVRNIVGTLVHIGCGKLSPDSIPAILASRDRKQAGVSAPAHGLYLHQVFYPTTNTFPPPKRERLNR